MYLNQFPDLQWLKKTIQNRFENQKGWNGVALPTEGWPNVILDVKTQNIYRDNIAGPVSLFGNLSGNSVVTVEGRSVVVPAGYFFVTNDKQEYTLEVGKQSANTFNIHFGNQFVSQALQSFLSEEIESNFKSSENNFKNRLIPFSTKAKSVIQKIQQNHDSMNEEENLFDLFSFLVDHETKLKQQSMQVDSLKKSTRDEVMKRLLVAMDKIYSIPDYKHSLNDLSKEACLSKFHFLRLFKSAFNKTPYQFINEVRIDRAKELLKNPQIPVKEIARQTGFDSSGTFSRTFYNTTGLYPTQFQRI